MRSLRTMTLSVLVLVAACDGSPTAPSAAAAPEPQLAVAGTSPIDIIYKKTTRFEWVRRFVVPCIVGDAGETVIFRGDGTATYARWRDAQGTLHHRFQWHIQSATATGYTSGETYRVSGSLTGTQLIGDAADVVRVGSRFRIAMPANGGVFHENAVHRFVVTPDGDLVYESTDATSECVGPTGADTP